MKRSTPMKRTPFKPKAWTPKPVTTIDYTPRARAPAVAISDGKAHMGRIAAMPCICCELLEMEQETPTNVHHIREGRVARNDFLTLPLCWACHQGPRGVHGTKGWLSQLCMSEVDLLGAVIERMAKERA